MSADLRKRAEAIVEAHCENSSGGIFTGGDDLRECIYYALVAVRDEALEDGMRMVEYRIERLQLNARDARGIGAALREVRALKVKP